MEGFTKAGGPDTEVLLKSNILLVQVVPVLKMDMVALVWLKGLETLESSCAQKEKKNLLFIVLLYWCWFWMCYGQEKIVIIWYISVEGRENNSEISFYLNYIFYFSYTFSLLSFFSFSSSSPWQISLDRLNLALITLC
jgi:hypothetical protein